MPDDDGQPMTGPYDDRDLPAQGDPVAPRCHRCDRPRRHLRGGWLWCDHCDRAPQDPTT